MSEYGGVRGAGRRITGTALLYVLLAAVTLPLVFPFAWMVSSALKDPADVFAYPPQLVPEHVRWSNIAEVFTAQPFALQMYNSLYIAVSVTLLTCAFALLSGYAFARLRFPGRNVIFFAMLAALMLPSEVTLVPVFALMQRLGLVDTHVPLIAIPVFGSTGVMATFLMRQFFLAMPAEIEEAAQLDGLGRLGIIWRIALPLARPMLGTVAIIAFLASWNSFLEPTIFLDSPELFTIPVAIAGFTDTSGNPEWNLQMAATAVSTLPVLLAYLIARRQVTESLAHTGIK
jgi:multiple sugar transport system permease protein